MAYALRYYKEIAQTDGGVVRLEIHKKDSTTSAVEIGAVVQGLSLEIQGQQDDIDTPIQKTSLHMTFVDASDIENGQKNGFWQEFYTPDALMWRVILKAKDAGETSFRTIWGGYVTPDSFSEDLVYRGSVSITARDNIGHMQDFTFDALGDADGLISLYNLVSMGWEKIQSPMKLSWKGAWLDCSGSIAYDTLMNVSQFKDGNWYKAIETALASYGAVMRYVGDNTVIITTLRSLPGQGGRIDDLPHINPLFVTGATRELVPAVKRIEESVDYDLEDSWSIPQIQPSDYTGMTYTYRCKVEGENWGTAEHDAPVWAIPINNERGWDNFPSESLFFNIDAYEVGYFSDYRGLGEEVKRYMYIAANNVDDRSVWYSKQMTCADVSLRIKFGLPVCLNRDSQIEQMSVFALKSIRYTISLKKDDSVLYYAGSGTWQVDEKILEKTYDISANETEFVEQIGMDDNVGICDLVFEIKKIEYAKTGYGSIANVGLYACIQDIAFTTASTSSLRETNTVNTSYNADNNVILSRDPELGPAYDNVAIPAFIKNGIFYRNADDEILPARLWSWGGSEQQMAVWNHLQLLCYYAKPNNLISGTIVNADITRIAAIYEWGHAEHILVSGRYNFLNGHIEGAVLREFARYEDMWSEVAGAGMPETEQDSRSNVEGGASSSASPSTYTATQNVNIGTGGGGGGASYLGDLQDVDIEGVVAQSVLYYNGTSWVDMSLATLVNPLLNPYLKTSDAEATYATLTAFNNLASKVKAEEDITATYKSWWDDLKSLIVKDGENNIKIKGNLIVAGDTSTGGTGSNPEVAGTLIGIKVNGQTYDNPVNGILTIPDYPTSLEWSAINGKPTKLTEFTNDAGFITSAALANYLPKSGGTLTGALTLQAEQYTGNYGLDANNSDIINVNAIYTSDLANKANEGIQFVRTNGNYDSLWAADGVLYFSPNGNNPEHTGSYSVNNTIYHSGNFNPADYLPLSGGTITSSNGNPLLINSTGSHVGVVWRKSGTNKGWVGYDSSGFSIYSYVAGVNLGIKDDGTPFIGSNTIIHSGNIGSYNAGSATKLQTARTIWGQSFDGTGNVSGNIQGGKANFTIYGYNSTSASNVNILTHDNNKSLWLGYGMNAEGNSTIIAGTSIEFRYGTSRGTAALINSSGNVGIGTTDPYCKLDVNGSVKCYNVIAYANNTYDIGSNSAMFRYAYVGWLRAKVNEKLILGANNGSHFYIATNGYVGINKSAPEYRLDVNGTARISDAVTMSSRVSIGKEVAQQTAGRAQLSLVSTTDEPTDFILGPNAPRWSITSRNSTDQYPYSLGIYDYAAAAYRMRITSAGDVYIYKNLVVSGDTSSGSDIRFKDKITDHRIALSDIADAPLFTFKWNDREDDSVHLGSSAQYWEKVAPWLVKGDDFKTLDYSTLGVAIGISLANKTLNLEDRVKILEKENKALKEQIRRIQYGS